VIPWDGEGLNGGYPRSDDPEEAAEGTHLGAG
jgi:hypothetical protein